MLQEKTFTDKRALWPFLKRIFKYSFRYKKWMLGFAFWIVVVSITEAIFPLIFLGVIDHAISPQLLAWKEATDAGTTFTPDLYPVLKYGIYFMILGLINIVGVFYFIKYAGQVQEYVMYNLREDMFKKLQKLSFSFYDKSASGWLLTRLTSDTDRVAQVISWGALDAVWGITMLSFCLVALFFYSWQLGLIVMVSIPIMLILSIRIRMLVLKYSRDARKINSELTASYNEHINGVEVIKSSGQEEAVAQNFQGLSNKMLRSSYRASYYTAMYIPLVIFIGSLAAAAVVFWGGSLVVFAGLTVGAFVAGYEYAMRIFMPIVDLSMFYARAQGSLSAGERIFSLLDEKLEIKDKKNARHSNTIKGDINFKNVDFYYKKENPVLQNFNLHIKEGQTIALVGATGEGKSTIINLVCRFYEPVQGELCIDGTDYREFSLESFRKQLGVVLQTPHLFSGTIKENIIYGRMNASDEDVIQALRLVGAEDFIPRLEEEVGEEGTKLSMGQKQLLSFARAILADPRIFIMDEATSSIDTITEKRIQKGIEKMLEGRTAIVIAHRLSTIKNSDRILVIQGGAIIEDGPHEKLMQQKGKYYDLYTHQWKAEKLTMAQ